VLESQQLVGFCDMVTDDESWLLQRYDHRRIRRISADEIRIRVTHTIAALKTILTVFLSIDGAIAINRLTPGEKFNTGHFCEKYPNRFPGSCTAGVLQALQDRSCILMMPYFIDQLQLKLLSTLPVPTCSPTTPQPGYQSV
jgi:hypothetical protein